MRLNKSSDDRGQTLTFRQRVLKNILKDRQSIVVYREREFGKDVKLLGGKTGSVKWDGQVVSGSTIPLSALPGNVLKG